MRVTKSAKLAITTEYERFKDKQYAGKTKKEREALGQYFTPPELSIKMIECFSNLKPGKTLLDPTCGAGGLLAAAILSGHVNPKDCYGIELDPEVLEVAQKRLGKLGVPKSHLHLGNALNEDCYEFGKRGYRFDPDNGKLGTVYYVYGNKIKFE